MNIKLFSFSKTKSRPDTLHWRAQFCFYRLAKPCSSSTSSLKSDKETRETVTTRLPFASVDSPICKSSSLDQVRARADHTGRAVQDFGYRDYQKQEI